MPWSTIRERIGASTHDCGRIRGVYYVTFGKKEAKKGLRESARHKKYAVPENDLAQRRRSVPAHPVLRRRSTKKKRYYLIGHSQDVQR